MPLGFLASGWALLGVQGAALFLVYCVRLCGLALPWACRPGRFVCRGPRGGLASGWLSALSARWGGAAASGWRLPGSSSGLLACVGAGVDGRSAILRRLWVVSVLVLGVRWLRGGGVASLVLARLCAALVLVRPAVHGWAGAFLSAARLGWHLLQSWHFG